MDKKVIPQIDVYYSPDDIQPGERWSDSIKDGLKGNPMGIFFVVEENIVQPWLNFEAGAISNQVGNTNVIPLLHDIEPSRVTGPLTQFQAISYSKADLKKLVVLINSNIKDIRRIDKTLLHDIFEKWYPDFDNEYNKFKTENPSPEKKEISGVLDEDGQLSEILSILRSMERGKDADISKFESNPFAEDEPLYFVSKGIMYNSKFLRNDNSIYYDGKIVDRIYLKYAEDFKANYREKIIELVDSLSHNLKRLPNCEEISAESEIPVNKLKRFICYEELPF